MLLKQEQELAKYRNEINMLKRENDNLEKCKQQEEDRLCAIIKKVEQMQVNYRQTMQQQIEKRRSALLQMDWLIFLIYLH